jgi:hypothetical protein
MKNALGITRELGKEIAGSEMCGTSTADRTEP